MNSPRIYTSSAGLGETLETRHLPVVGRSEGRLDRLSARLAFWRRYGLVLTVFCAVRIVLDVAL